jgi:hypothetical protein
MTKKEPFTGFVILSEVKDLVLSTPKDRLRVNSTKGLGLRLRGNSGKDLRTGWRYETLRGIHAERSECIQDDKPYLEDFLRYQPIPW